MTNKVTIPISATMATTNNTIIHGAVACLLQRLLRTDLTFVHPISELLKIPCLPRKKLLPLPPFLEKSLKQTQPCTSTAPTVALMSVSSVTTKVVLFVSKIVIDPLQSPLSITPPSMKSALEGDARKVARKVTTLITLENLFLVLHMLANCKLLQNARVTVW